jgi:hypothetical protein
VLFGPRKGNVDVSLEISGALVRRLLRQDVRVTNGPKVIGGFYVGRTEFFKQHLRFMDLVHELLWCYEDGVRRHPSPAPEHWPGRPAQRARLTVKGRSPNFRGNEDTLRNLVVYATGAGDRLHIVDPRGRIRIDRSKNANP